MPCNDSIEVTLHEVHSRTFTVDVDALCEDMDWPRDFDHGDLAEIIEHSDSWRSHNNSTNLAWLVEQLPSEGWREVYEIASANPLPAGDS